MRGTEMQKVTKLGPYKGYDLRLTQDGRVCAVLNGKPEYVAQTGGEAKRWVTGYRDGVTWAVVAKLEQDALRASVMP
jgi:hypothetical protein